MSSQRLRPRVFVGIDPGIAGAVGVLAEDGSLVSIQSMPTRVVMATASKRASRKKVVQKTVVGLGQLLKLLREIGTAYEVLYCVVERMRPFRRAASDAIFAMGENEGVLRAFMVTLLWRNYFAYPQTWQDEIIPNTPKDGTKAASIKAASECWGAACLLKTKKSRVPDDNRADALNIAAYARLRYMEKEGTDDDEDPFTPAEGLAGDAG